ncbi:MAG TPA: glycosyltransferase, partial [Candidatus Sulfotelmatobacter sp.]|nr:glycosyltransferase [Candidatus Sulfotelmatobacter sp.]
MPRISVITPTYNCAAFLPGALTSALGQSYRDLEVLVVDDGSTDGTREMVEAFGSPVRYLWQPNRGVSAARNLALAAAG